MEVDFSSALSIDFDALSPMAGATGLTFDWVGASGFAVIGAWVLDSPSGVSFDFKGTNGLAAGEALVLDLSSEESFDIQGTDGLAADGAFPAFWKANFVLIFSCVEVSTLDFDYTGFPVRSWL